MPTTALTKTQFDHALDQLARLKERVAAVLRPAVDAYLAFAKEYWTLYQTVEGDPGRVALLRKRLGITEDYQHQRLRRIAEQSETLRPFKNALPAAVEPLYEVALVAAKNPKRLKEITAESGIREIRDLKKPRGATSGHKKSSRRPSTAIVSTLTVSGYNEKHLAHTLAALLDADMQAEVRCDSPSVVAATKAALVSHYEQHAKERGETVPHAPDVSWNPVLAYEQLQKGTKPGGTKADDVVENKKHPYHCAEVPNSDRAEKLKQDAEDKRWLVPEIGLTYGHYAPALKARQERISKR
jgi:hypothetical protein